MFAFWRLSLDIVTTCVSRCVCVCLECRYLPRAHTCFFSLELPRYTSKDTLRSKLLTAIHGGVVEEYSA